MKKIENTFAVTGFVGKDAEIRSFTNASVARFSLAIGRHTWPKAPCLPWRAISSPKDGQTKTASSIIASRW